MRRVHIAKTSAVLVTCVALALGIAGPACATSKIVLSRYAPFPKAALTGVGASFARPTRAQVASVRVSVTQAYTVGLTQTGTLPKGAKVTVRLGLFSDKEQSIVRGKVLAYVVIFDGVNHTPRRYNMSHFTLQHETDVGNYSIESAWLA